MTDVKLNRDEIRAVLLTNGFKVPEGRDDLRDYVYFAAEELLALQRERCARVAAQMNAPAVAGALGGTKP